MKLTFAMVLLLSLQISAKVHSQNVTLNIKNARLSNIFLEIEKITPYRVIFNDDAIPKDKIYSVRANNKDINDVLRDLLIETPLTYKITRNNLLVITNRSNLQTLQVTGRVSDPDNEPLIGVSIAVKGTTKGTTTDVNGNYKITVNNKQSVLVFKYIGYGFIEQTVGEQTVINVTMKEDPKSINEVVVVGYGTQQARDVTGSIGSVSAGQIENMPVTSFDQALSGQIAGVQVQQTSGEPGGNINVTIRGAGSIGAGNQPLYVVDGFPGITDLSSIDPNDIESIDVLKDASAAAIYGSRGANGVVIVTTKRGKAGQTKFSVNSYSGTSQVINKVDVMNAQEYANHAVRARNNGALDAGANIDLMQVKNSERSGSFRIHPFFILNDSTVNSNLGAGTDWQDEVFQLAPTRNLQITATGGTEKVRYSVSGAFFQQQGVVIESGFARFNSRINLDAELTKKLKVGISLAPSYTTRDIVKSNDTQSRQGIILTSLTMSPTSPVFNPDGTYLDQVGVNAGNGLNGSNNPVSVARLFEEEESGIATTGNIFLDYEVINGLSLRASSGANINNTLGRDYHPSTLGRPGSSPPSIPVANSSSGARADWVNNITATYNKTFFTKHNLTALLGNEYQKQSNRTSSLEGTNFPTDAAPYLGAAGIITDGSSGISESAYISYFGRVTYNFDRKYLLTFNIRRDGSSRFGPETRYGTFPSASIGWQVTDEPFMKNLPVIGDLKLRASFGLGGNDNIGNYAYRSLLSSGEDYIFGGGLGTQVTGLAPNNLSNTGLKWERSQQLNLGVDLGLFQNRVFFVADYYEKETRDLLLNVQISRSAGYNAVIQNIGSIRNVGWEFTLNTRNLVNKFQWNTDFNMTFNRNNVLALGPEGDPILASASQINQSHIVEVGKPLGNFYGYFIDGVYNTQEEIDNTPQWETGNPARPGDYRFRDVNGDGIINSFDRTVIGNAFPDFDYGMTNSFRFKNFDLSILLQGRQGNDVINGTRRFMATGGIGTNQLAGVDDGWKSPEQRGNGLARAWSGSGTNNNNANMNSKWMEDGSYLSIRNINFGYQLPKKFLDKISVQSLRFYTTVQNAFIFTNYLGYNPDVSFNDRNILNPGVDYGSYPLARTVSLGLNVGF